MKECCTCRQRFCIVRGVAASTWNFRAAQPAALARLRVQEHPKKFSSVLERAAHSKSTTAATRAAVRVYAHDRSNDERGLIATAWLSNVAEFGIAQ